MKASIVERINKMLSRYHIIPRWLGGGMFNIRYGILATHALTEYKAYRTLKRRVPQKAKELMSLGRMLALQHLEIVPIDGIDEPSSMFISGFPYAPKVHEMRFFSSDDAEELCPFLERNSKLLRVFYHFLESHLINVMSAEFGLKDYYAIRSWLEYSYRKSPNHWEDSRVMSELRKDLMEYKAVLEMELQLSHIWRMTSESILTALFMALVLGKDDFTEKLKTLHSFHMKGFLVLGWDHDGRWLVYKRNPPQ